MPWHNVYEPAPQDKSLRVWQKDELPVNAQFTGNGGLYRNFDEADLMTDETWLHWYECRHCGGWIEGRANGYSVNTLDSSRLAGRRGTEWYCRRCGEQIGFIGMLS